MADKKPTAKEEVAALKKENAALQSKIDRQAGILKRFGAGSGQTETSK